MKRRVFVGGVSAFAVGAQAALAQTRVPVTIATIANDPLVAPFYAKDRGFFERAGLDAAVQAMDNGAEVTAAVASGAIDIGGSNLSSIVVAYRRGVPIKVIAPAGIYSKTSPVLALIVLQNSPITSAKDLEGKVIAASPLRSLSEFGPSLWIDQHGGDSTKVKYVEMPFGEMGAALVQGRIAAAALTEPYFSEAQGTCRVLAYPYSAIAPTFMTTAYFTSNAYAKAHPEVIDRFQSAIRTTARWANENTAKSGAILADVTKLDPAIIARMSRVGYAEALDPVLIQPNIDLAVRFKIIDVGFQAQDMIYQRSR